MDINSKKGDKVRVTRESIKNGYSGVRRHAMKHLEVGKEYTIEYTIVYESVTDVYIKEIPKEVFNSVSFEDQVGVHLSEGQIRLMKKINYYNSLRDELKNL
tara:strand:+ start:3194 stop:3496 length:303 start_codon:yes stop_codon:yes gene_type:complete